MAAILLRPKCTTDINSQIRTTEDERYTRFKPILIFQ